MISRLCFAAAFALIAWAAHAIVFNPPMLFSTGSSTVIDLGTATGGNGATSAKVTIGPGGVPAGSTIVVLVVPTTGSGALGGVIDTQSNTYAQKAIIRYDSNVLFAAMYVCQNCAALTPGNTITFSISGGASIMSALAIRTSQAVSLDLNTTPTSGKSTTPSLTSGTPSVAGEIFVGGVAYVTASPTTALVQAVGWTTPPDFATPNSNQSLGGGWLKNPGTSPQTYTPTLTGSNFWGIMLMSFKL